MVVGSMGVHFRAFPEAQQVQVILPLDLSVAGKRSRIPAAKGYGGIMNLAVVQKEVAAWSPDEQDRLAAYLTVLRMTRSPEHTEELSRRLDDRQAGTWLSLKEVKEGLEGGR